VIRLELEPGGAAELAFASPPVNQLSHAFLGELERALDRLGPDTRALAVVSDVPRVFMAGADIDFLANGDLADLRDYVAWVQRTFSRFEQMPWPVVVGIDGACLGGGLELSLASDIRIVTPAARLGLPEVKLGILAGAGGPNRLVRAIGQGAARDLLLTGRRVSGEEALAMGIASRLVPDGQAADAARALAHELAGGAAEAIQATKRLAVAASENEIGDGLAQEAREWIAVRGSRNAQEGLAAFLEKRTPAYT